MKKSVFLGKGLTILFSVTMMLGVMLSAGRMEVSAAENDANGNTIERSTPAGDGTEDNPYQIGTKEELYWFAALVNNGDNGACAVLTADITVNTGVLGENGELAKNGDELISWTPISKIQYSYSGIFDGQNHTISGLYFNNPKEEEQDAGLFRRLKASGKIINVGIVDSYFNGENYVGGVCGFNNGTIKNCYYSGTVNGSYCVGGICGENEKSIENCYHIGTVSGTSYVGSICGYNKADVKNCYYDNSTGVEKAIGEDTGTAKDVSGKSTKDMHSSDFCKLITYHSCRNITCSLCGGYQEATCNTDGTYEIGNASQLYWFADKVNNENGTYGNANAVLTKDIVVNQNVLKSDGTLNGDGISFKSWTPIGTVSYSTISQGLLENVHLYNGTFDGRNHTISGLYFNNTSTSYIGLFGYVGTSGKISNVGIIDSYFNGKYYVGSICGYNSGGTMEDCYNTANVSGSNYIGGICGYKSGGTIKTCYHTANVSSLQDNSSNVGGICGYNAKGEIISCYYDSTTYSGEKVGTNKGTLACVDGKTAEQFKSGEVTYLLQGNPGEETEVVWGQTLTGDDQQDFPVLSGKPVYQIYQYAVCEYAANQEEPTKTLYSNSNQDIYEPHKDDGSVSGSVAYDNKCDYCGEPCHSFNENGICEEEGCGYYQGIITNATYSTTVAYCGDATDAQPKTDDFTVASGTKPEFTWYKGDVTTGDLPTVENALGKDAPKELGIYTLVVNAAGAQKDGTVYTAAELRVKVTITKAQLEGSVTIDGTLRCNETVTVNTTGITNEKPGDFVYQWYRVNGQIKTIIIDATGASYTLTQEDIGKKIKVVVTSEYCNGTLEATTEATTEATIKKIAAPMEGEGTAEEPYQLGTKEDLYWFAGLVNGTLPSGEQNQSAHAVLTKDIVVNTGVFDANGDLVDTGNFIKWTPIGMNLGKSFRGTFDGQNHTISGLYFDKPTKDFVGLFGCSRGGNILKVGVIDSYFKGNSYVSGVCAWNEEATITYCYNAGKVSGSDFVGGVCAYVNDGSIQYCYNTNAVEGTKDDVGGVCGRLMDVNSSVKYSYNTGKVSGSDAVGGVCGDICDGTIQYCYNTNVVEGTEPVGGVCGATYGGTVKDSYYDMEVYSNSVPIGINSNGMTTVANVEGKTTADMHSATFCDDSIKYHSYQNGICALCATAYQEAPCNNGTYEISNAGQLYWFADKVNSDSTYQSANAVLTADIVVNKNVLNSDGTLNKDSSFKDWIPIGRYYVDSNGNIISYPYAGVFDGQNHTISGVYYESSNEDYGGGLFGKVEGNVRNIGILDSYFNGSVNYLGGICGENSGTIENCYNTGTVSGAGPVGGICGMNKGTIENCYNTGTVSGEMENIGGICGGSSSSTIKNCYNTGTVSGLQFVGGVCGSSDRDTIANCYNIGKVAGSSNVGGVCGYYSGNTISNCYYNNEVYAGTAIGVDNNGTATKVGGKTTDEFKSGEVAWLLQDGQEDQTELVWGQTLTGDSTQEFPVLKGEKVYKVNKYAVCEDAKDKEPTEEYSNSNKDIYGSHKDDGSGNLNKAYDNKCDFCGAPCHAFEGGICKEDGYHQGIITNAHYSATVAYCGEHTDAQPKPGDFTVASGTEPEFTWYKDNVITGDLPTDENALGKDAPKNEGTYTLVVNAAGAENNGVVYTATELRVLVTIAKAPLAGTVTLEGTLKCNETVTVNTDDITHPHPGNLSYQWYRVDGENETEIATEPSYTLTTKDIGKKIRVEVYAENCTECLSATTETTVNKLDGSAEIKSTSEELSKYWDETTILTPTFRTGNNEGANNENVTFEYKKITDTDYTMTAPTDAGTYHVRVKVKADSIHSEAVSEPVEFTIAKVNSEVEVAPVAAKNLIYTQGKTVTLIDASNASVTGGQLQYALGENGTYSTALPTVTAAGTYSVYYKVVGDQNHNDTKPVKIEVMVSKNPENKDTTTSKSTEETTPKEDATTQQPGGTTEGSTVSQSPKNGDTITDNKSNAKYTVTDTVKKNVTYIAPVTIKAKTITIPATIKINGEIYKVTKIDKNALKGNKKVTKIVVGSNIQSIGNYAFSGCKKLKTIIIQSKKLTTKTVSKKAFKGIARKVVVKVPKKKRTAYKKLLKKKGLSSKNRIKNY